jgi:general secretion pathway protein J
MAAMSRAVMSGRGQGGFTLLELLVAMTLLGFVALLLAGGLRFGVAAWRAAQLRSDQAAQAAGLHDALARLIGQAQAEYASDDPADLTLTFDGGPDRLRLIAPLPEAIEDGILAVQSLSLRPSGRGAALVLSWNLDLPAAEHRPAYDAVLADNVQSLHLRYWGTAQPDAGPDWSDTWQGQPRLPGLVRVQIDRAAAPALDFTFAVPATVGTGCRYDPVGPACRR